MKETPTSISPTTLLDQIRQWWFGGRRDEAAMLCARRSAVAVRFAAELTPDDVDAFAVRLERAEPWVGLPLSVEAVSAMAVRGDR